MSTTVIEVQDITKYFMGGRPLYKQFINPFKVRRKICALDKVSFHIESGEILGVVGANGAGKTTLLRILADLLKPASGKISFLVCSDKDSSELRSWIGYVPGDERSFFWRLTGQENLEFFGQLYGLSKERARQRSLQCIKAFGLDTNCNQLFRDYSSGIRKKFAVIRALLHSPYILVLDEVTNSLDPTSAKMVKTLVRKYVLQQSNRAAIWSTHRLEEIAEICDRILLLEKGRVKFCGLVSDFNKTDSSRADYLLRARDLNGKHGTFHKCCSQITGVKSSQNGKISEFLFKGISSEIFGNIITMAVKDYGAYVVYAGYIDKNKNITLDL